MCAAHRQDLGVDALAITHEKHEREAIIADRHDQLEIAVVILQPVEWQHEAFRPLALAVERIDEGRKAELIDDRFVGISYLDDD